MKNLANLTNFINLFIICLIINISPSFQILIKYEIKIPINNGKLSNFFFTMYGRYDVCEKWVPSLFNPILLVSSEVELKYGDIIPKVNHELRYPFLNENKGFTITFFSSVKFGNYRLYLGRPIRSSFYECYFGLSPNKYKFQELREGINPSFSENFSMFKEIFRFREFVI